MVIVGMVQYMHEGPEINTKMDTTRRWAHGNYCTSIDRESTLDVGYTVRVLS